MIITIAVGVLFLAVVIYMIYNETQETYKEWELVVMGAMVAAPLAILVWAGASAVSLAIVGSHYEVQDRVELANLQDGSDVHGSFFLGTGHVGSDSKFYYYENDNGRYRLRNVDADDAEIVETEGTPHLEIEHKVSNNRTVTWFSGGTRYTFYVPAGSIKHDYILDAQ